MEVSLVEAENLDRARVALNLRWGVRFGSSLRRSVHEPHVVRGMSMDTHRGSIVEWLLVLSPVERPEVELCVVTVMYSRHSTKRLDLDLVDHRSVVCSEATIDLEPVDTLCARIRAVLDQDWAPSRICNRVVVRQSA